MTYRAMCKCRLCGEVYKNGAATGSKELAIFSIVEMETKRHTQIQAPTLIDIHHCKDGSIGCADFVGWKAEV